MMQWALVALALMISGCRSLSPTMTGAKEGPLYPNGVYQHNVKFEMRKPQTRQIRMRGVLARKPGNVLSLVGLSPLSTTLFRIQDSSTGAPQLTIYEPRMQPLEPHLRANYKIMRELLLVNREAMPEQLKDDKGNAVRIAVTDYDGRGIPRSVSLQAGAYSIDIEVSDYDLE